MKATLIAPIAAIHGSLRYKGEYYIRMLNGKAVVQRRPNRTKPPTEKQIKVRQLFAKRYAGRHLPQSKTPNLNS